MSKILKFNNDQTLKEEIQEKIDIIANEYITTITDYGIKLYGMGFPSIPEYRKMCSDMFCNGINKAIANHQK